MAGPFSLRRLVWAGPVSTLAALALNFLYYVLTKSLGETYLIPIDASGSHVGPMATGMFVLPTILVGLAATGLFAVLIRFFRAAGIMFLSVAVAAFILSLGGPSSLPNTSLKTQLLLIGMNLLTALVLTGGLLLLSRKKPVRQN